MGSFACRVLIFLLDGDVQQMNATTFERSLCTSWILDVQYLAYVNETEEWLFCGSCGSDVTEARMGKCFDSIGESVPL